MFWWKKKKSSKKPESAKVPPSDSAVNENVATLSSSTAMALDQALHAQSQAQGILFTNMVNEQKERFEAGQVAAIKIAADIYGISTDKIMGPLK